MASPKVETIVIPEEFLVRWGEKGELMGAHLVTQTKIFIDGVLVSSTFDPPIALDSVADPRFVEILGKVTLDQGAKIEELTQLGSQLESDLNDQISLVAARNETIAILQFEATQQESDRHSVVSELQGQLAEQRRLIGRLEPENALLGSEVDRLSAQNSGLMAQVQELQTSVSQLTIENEKLQAEIDLPVLNEQEL
jgi:hypothetical protein